MTILGQITNISSPPVLMALVVAGGLVLLVAVKIGGVILKLLFVLAGLALLGGVLWWFFPQMIHGR